MNVHPIQFAMPDTKVAQLKVEKSTFFSDLSPLGRAKKYKFFVETEYYAHYAKSFFAVTMKKGGWDCLRHYEILASGTLPYFIGIEDCPANTLFAWPKDLLSEIKNIPGMPSERQVKKATEKDALAKLKPGKDFDEKVYWKLHGQMLDIFHQRLTSKGLSQYFLETVGAPEKAKVLVCFGLVGSALDYQRDLLIAALGNDDRVKLTTYPKPYWHERGCHRLILNTFYGRGFSCTASVDPARLHSPADWRDIEAQIDDFDVIVACSSSNHGFSALPQEVQGSLSRRKDIVWIDGNDVKADHSVPECARMTFRREME